MVYIPERVKLNRDSLHTVNISSCMIDNPFPFGEYSRLNRFEAPLIVYPPRVKDT